MHTWEARDVAGVQWDEWTPPPRDHVAWIDASTLDGWDTVRRFYRKDIAVPDRLPQSWRDLARELGDGATSNRERIERVYAYASGTVRYGRHPREQSRSKVRDADAMLLDLRGDCKDKSALIVGLLRELGVTASIAVVLSRDNGREAFLPSARFDHALVRIQADDATLWLDPAAGPYRCGELPVLDQGIPALLLDGDDGLLRTPEPQPADHALTVTGDGTIAADGRCVVTITATARGDRAARLRENLRDRSPDHRRRQLAQSALGEYAGAIAEEVWLEGVDDLTQDVRYGMRLVLDGWVRRIEALLLLRVPWHEPLHVAGPVSAAERIQPLQAPGPQLLEETLRLELPPGFAGYGLPYTGELRSTFLDYDSRIAVADGCLVCERRIAHRDGVIAVDGFAAFRDAWQRCARHDSADVVLASVVRG